MVTLREAAQQAIKALERADKINGYPNNAAAIKALRQALEADTKPCACCGEGKARISVTRICDTCGSEYAGRAEMDAAKRIEAEQQAEPVAWKHDCDALCIGIELWIARCPHCGRPRSAHQQPAQQPLTEEKIADLFSVACRETFSGLERFIYFTRLVESFHNIK